MANAFTRASERQLMAFWSRYHRARRSDAEALLGSRFLGYTNVAASFANYACNLAVAMGCRASGKDLSAAIYDHAAQLSLDSIPLEHRRVLDEYVFPETDEQRSK